MMLTSCTEQEVLLDVQSGIGFITLNKTRSLNALTQNMCARVDQALIEWADDDAVKAVVIQGAGEKAFCAGGDVISITNRARADVDEAMGFFEVEYNMNSRIFHFPKPYIALLDGYTMGGGVGISAYGSHKIVTERTLFSMPETRIGLIPDVGTSYLLSRMPGMLGMYLALTGDKLKAEDALYCGFGSAYIPSTKLDDFVTALKLENITSHDDVDHLIARFAELPEAEGYLETYRDVIDVIFAEDNVRQMKLKLQDLDDEWAQKTIDTLNIMSPTSLQITCAQIGRGKELDFDDCLIMEYRIVHRMLREGSDFFEGVRAILVDKDMKFDWQPSRVRDVTEQDIQRHFKPLANDLVIKKH